MFGKFRRILLIMLEVTRKFSRLLYSAGKHRLRQTEEQEEKRVYSLRGQTFPQLLAQSEGKQQKSEY